MRKSHIYRFLYIVFLLQSSEYDTISQCLPDLLETICNQVLIFWPEDFNGVSMKNFDCLLEREGQILQYDIFLLTAYDRTTWGGAANKLHYLPKEKQKHLQYYYCDNDLDKTAQNLHQSMLWFEEDVLELDTTEAGGQNQINSEKSQSHGPWDEKFHCTYAKIKKAWEKMMDITS